MENKYISIAIDGPSASGKSTVAKILAKDLSFVYVDSGAMYRAYTLAVLQASLDPKNEEESNKLINKIDVANNVSYIASYKNVRLFLVDLQRKIAKGKNIVMDGRDIGTYVLENAQVKIFLVANEDERARRRFHENQQKGIETTFEACLENIKKRDYIDSHRSFCPLKPAPDSILLDSTKLSIKEVTNKIKEIIKEKGF